MLAKQVTDPKAGKLVAATIDKQCRVHVKGMQALFDEPLQQLGSLRPDRADAHPVPLALQSDLARPLHAQVAQAKVEYLLHPCTGIEHEREQCVVAPSGGGRSIDRL
ncbi:hypothetical protein D3C81_2054530 [compost metagenome]